MTNKQMVAKLAKRTGASKADAQAFLDAFEIEMREELSQPEGGSFELGGVFTVKTWKKLGLTVGFAKNGDLESKRVPHFYLDADKSSTLRKRWIERLNGNA